VLERLAHHGLGVVKAGIHGAQMDEIKRVREVDPVVLGVLLHPLHVGMPAPGLDLAEVGPDDVDVRVLLGKFEGPDAGAGADVQDIFQLAVGKGREVEGLVQPVEPGKVREVQAVLLDGVVGQQILAILVAVVGAAQFGHGLGVRDCATRVGVIERVRGVGRTVDFWRGIAGKHRYRRRGAGYGRLLGRAAKQTLGCSERAASYHGGNGLRLLTLKDSRCGREFCDCEPGRCGGSMAGGRRAASGGAGWISRRRVLLLRLGETEAGSDVGNVVLVFRWLPRERGRGGSKQQESTQIRPGKLDTPEAHLRLAN
jgi:hypothetical protein